MVTPTDEAAWNIDDARAMLLTVVNTLRARGYLSRFDDSQRAFTAALAIALDSVKSKPPTPESAAEQARTFLLSLMNDMNATRAERLEAARLLL